MAGPWEKYQTAPEAQPAPAEPAGPWAKYAPAAAPVVVAPGEMKPGSRGYADWAAQEARGGKTLPQVSQDPSAFDPAPRPEGEWVPLGSDQPGTPIISDIVRSLYPAEGNTETHEWRPAVPTIVSSVIEALGSAFNAPGDALSGKMNPEIDPSTLAVNPYPDRMVEGAMDMAGLVTGGEMPLAHASGRRAATKGGEAPSSESLKERARAKYKEAEGTGLVVSQPSAKALADNIASEAMKVGLDETLTPGSVAAVKRMQANAGRNMTVEDFQVIRELFGTAAAGNDPKLARDRMIAAQAIEAMDDFLSGVGKTGPAGEPNMAVLAGDGAKAGDALTEARGLYSRAKKGDMIDQAIELAWAKSDRVGLENAIRTEFGILDRAIIKGQIKNLTDDEIAAIQEVARGGSIENALRFVGKAAPTGVVSGALGTLAPVMAGVSIGGPAGAALGAAVPLAGITAKSVAKGISVRNANEASELARRGGPRPKAPLLMPDELAQILSVLGVQAQENDVEPEDDVVKIVVRGGNKEAE